MKLLGRVIFQIIRRLYSIMSLFIASPVIPYQFVPVNPLPETSQMLSSLNLQQLVKLKKCLNLLWCVFTRDCNE